MSDDTTPDPSLLARQQRQILTEMGSVRDDLAVLTAIAMRQDGTLAVLPAEMRAMHSQHSGLVNRVCDLEPQR
ncbi:MAG TPA: hypothetical protein VFE41_36020 [Acetobacteraceae bacterium]|jgi:hypothetical protein|nr:hypothetical protein [Acetobacteraceae bacterium]